MVRQSVPIRSDVSADFSIQCRHLITVFKSRGMPLHTMNREGMLEQQLQGGNFDDRSGARAGSVQIRRIENEIRAVAIPRTTEPTRLRYFIDGSQKTYPMFCIGQVPVFATIAAAAILERGETGATRLLPGTLQLRHAWIVPEKTGDPRLTALCEEVHAMGGTIIDPLIALNQKSDAYRRAADDYLHLEAKAIEVSRSQREQIERKLLLDWSRQYGNQGDWIVVDGALRAAIPHAVGLVKSFNYQYLAGEEAALLFNLPAQHRTSAFVAANRWRTIHSSTDTVETEPADERVLWYLRFWDAAGYDARHALVRIETSADFQEPDQIDQLSAWLLAERAPRATADARWDTLLYPIHLLERLLKRRIDNETRLWPGARQR